MRLKRLRKIILENNLGTILISHPANRRYLSGFRAEDPQIGESAGYLAISQERAILLTDPRYAELAKRETDWEVRVYKRDFLKEMKKLLEELPRPIGFEARHLTYRLYQRLSESVEMVPTENVVETLRKIKDEEEIEAIKTALSITKNVFMELERFLRPGKTEREIAWWIEERIRKEYKAELAFSPIVASGANAAIPHATPSERPIKEHEPIIIDLGAKWDGYCSDMTRTFYLGEKDETFKRIYNLVHDAQSLVFSKICAGVMTNEADAIAREFFERHGYKDEFAHSLGHGVGLLVHEAPSLSPKEPYEKLSENMIVTVEPGLYLKGWGGVRLEDMVLIKKDKGIIL
ncbi:MAG: Xaa-Pro peptidase family protein [Deltaproteobacteria bacterium]|nr:Xaa-Pro peptidase family protein [Deltaproteobacteria bacterium]